MKQMSESEDLARLSSYFTACETLAESMFSDIPVERRQRIATWSAAVLKSLKDENTGISDIQLIPGSVAGLAVFNEKLPEGLERNDLRAHARNLLIGAFERGSDGISSLDLTAGRSDES